LPPIRILAEQLLINPNNRGGGRIANSKWPGSSRKRRTAGTYVSDQKSPLARGRERLRILTERVDALLAEARQMDVSV